MKNQKTSLKFKNLSVENRKELLEKKKVYRFKRLDFKITQEIYDVFSANDRVRVKLWRGNAWIVLRKVNTDMIGRYIGEFVCTRKFSKHTRVVAKNRSLQKNK